MLAATDSRFVRGLRCCWAQRTRHITELERAAANRVAEPRGILQIRHAWLTTTLPRVSEAAGNPHASGSRPKGAGPMGGRRTGSAGLDDRGEAGSCLTIESYLPN